jgi:ABC-type glycerol-3-phosphate transport system permease component
MLSIKRREGILSKSLKKQRNAAQVLFYLILLLYTAYTFLPMLWTFFLSFKPTSQILNNPYALPEAIRFTNYRTVFSNPDYVKYYMNSAIVVSLSIVILVIVGSMAAYYFGCFHFRGRALLFTAMFAAFMVPQQASLVPLFELLKGYHLLNSRAGLVLVYVATSLPLSIYVLSNYFAAIPYELAEAARIDGCSEWTLFWRVMFPIARPAVATVITFYFIQLWNEYLYAVVFIFKNSLRTLPTGLVHLRGEHFTDLGGLAAAFVMSMIPILVLYLLLSEHFIKGMTAGAVKG